jgi:YlmC/YmxH family sporulation protein
MLERCSRLYDLGGKEVINLTDGCRLGRICDLELDLRTGTVLAALVPGRLRLFGLLGREEEWRIPWKDIQRVGEDVIFVTAPRRYFAVEKPRWLW